KNAIGGTHPVHNFNVYLLCPVGHPGWMIGISFWTLEFLQSLRHTPPLLTKSKKITSIRSGRRFRIARYDHLFCCSYKGSFNAYLTSWRPLRLVGVLFDGALVVWCRVLLCIGFSSVLKVLEEMTPRTRDVI